MSNMMLHSVHLLCHFSLCCAFILFLCIYKGRTTRPIIVGQQCRSSFWRYFVGRQLLAITGRVPQVLTCDWQCQPTSLVVLMLYLSVNNVSCHFGNPQCRQRRSTSHAILLADISCRSSLLADNVSYQNDDRHCWPTVSAMTGHVAWP